MSNQPYGTLRWNRRVLITLVAVLMTAGSVTADSPGFVVTGRLSANDQEADEGYFALGSEITIVVRTTVEVNAIAEDLFERFRKK